MEATGGSHFAGFGVWKTGRAAVTKESRVIRFLMAMIGLFAALAPGLAHAQTNLDQGKSAATIFASDCVECHKAPHGMAKGKSVAQVTDFLHEHYTTSREQAAALAAYVLGVRGTEPADAAQARARKAAAEHASAATEEPKPSKRQAKQSPKADEAKSANTKSANAKPGTPKPANAKLRRPAPEQAEPKDQASRGEQPNIAEPENGQHEPHAATRNRRTEPNAPEAPQEPAALAHAPPAADTAPAAVETTPNQGASPGPGPGPAPSAAAPSDATTGDTGDNAPVPRDNIPD
jgi:hypothetical protein